jgi:hypothetical protein
MWDSRSKSVAKETNAKLRIMNAKLPLVFNERKYGKERKQQN